MITSKGQALCLSRVKTILEWGVDSPQKGLLVWEAGECLCAHRWEEHGS